MIIWMKLLKNFDSPLCRYQLGLESRKRGSDFIFGFILNVEVHILILQTKKEKSNSKS